MNKYIKELAELYEVQINDEPGCTFVDDNGQERPATKEDIILIFGLNEIPVLNNFSVEAATTFYLESSWVIEEINDSFDNVYLEVA